ncbi:MAG: hypothetical protein IID36_13265 [Planctomycetes bacterium]|nr:hypothetical protein [Planctomycetota bacterium]
MVRFSGLPGFLIAIPGGPCPSDMGETMTNARVWWPRGRQDSTNKNGHAVRNSRRLFAGTDIDKARCYPEDDPYLLEKAKSVVHYEVVHRATPDYHARG